jgi:hypothetical protein
MIMEVMTKATAMVVIQDIVRTILIKIVLVMLLIMSGMIEMMMMMMMIIIITIITIPVKPGDVSKNKMPTICITQKLSSPCGQNQMTSGSTAAICLSNSTLPTPPPSGVPTKSIEGRSSRKEAAIHQRSI